MRIPKLHIGTPMYGGMCTGTYVESLLKLTNLCSQTGVEVGSTFVYNESLITRARNRICDDFLKKSDFTHLLWVDADIGFDPQDVISMIKSGRDIIGAACVKKSLFWERIKAALKLNPELTVNEIMALSGDFVVHFLDGENGGKFQLDIPYEVKRLGTGFLMVKREVMEQMRDAYPDRYYSPAGDPTATLPGMIFEFFQSRIEPTSRQYLSEDYAFCDDARQLGFKVWLAPWVRTTHTGNFKFEGDLNAVAKTTGAL